MGDPWWVTALVAAMLSWSWYRTGKWVGRKHEMKRTPPKNPRCLNPRCCYGKSDDERMRISNELRDALHVAESMNSTLWWRIFKERHEAMHTRLQISEQRRKEDRARLRALLGEPSRKEETP